VWNGGASEMGDVGDRGDLGDRGGEREPDQVFAGSIPELYDELMVPLIFAEYAVDLATRLSGLEVASVLEVAAGTGVLTREMSARLPDTVEITATDLNQPMLDHAARIGTSRPVLWRQADVMALPFEDHSFDVVTCQFGAMFFPDKPAAFGEIRRVLRPGGRLVFNVWDRIETNDFARIVTDALGEVFPDDPPMFMARVPHGYHDEARIRADLAAAGFSLPATVEAVEARSRAATAEIPAIAYCKGTPLHNEIVARDAERLEAATAHAATMIERMHGPVDVDGRIRAYVVTVTSPF
jgi:SAM-dependent methyltransferase